MGRPLIVVVSLLVAGSLLGALPASAAPGVARSGAVGPAPRHDEQVTGGGHVAPAARLGKHPRLASSLVRVGQEAHQAGRAAAVDRARANGLAVRDERVRVSIQAHSAATDAIEALVARLGGTVERAGGGAVQALVAPADLDAIAADPTVRYVEPSRRLIPTAIAGEGATASGATGWLASGAAGAGVKIAVLDGDFLGYEARQASGDLPTTLETLNFCAEGLTNGLDGGHGTAVAEIVYEMAPGAQLYLVCAGTLSEVQAALPTLYGRGIQIINHSRGIFNTSRADGTVPPPSQGFLPEALVTDAFNHGVLWVNSAGNNATTHWSGTYVDTDADDVHNFAPADEGNSIVIPANGTVSIFLKWDDWPLSDQDYDLYLVRSSDGQVVAFSVDEQAGAALPTEELTFTNTGPTQQFFIAIVRYAATETPRFDLFVEGNTSVLEYQVAAGSLSDFAVSPRATVAGAACWQTANLEPYSSRGPTIDGRIKPDLTGFDSVSSATFGVFAGCGISAFSGTSAAAPYVAGAAVLGKDVNRTFTPSQLMAFLESKVIDRDAPGKENTWGAGLLALGALDLPAVACSPRPAVVVQTGVQSGLLASAVGATGDGNRLLKIAFGNGPRVPLNALLNFPDGSTNLRGTPTLYTPFGSTQTTFTAKREGAGAMTVPFVAHDRCGTWPSFVGAGTSVSGLN